MRYRTQNDASHQEAHSSVHRNGNDALRCTSARYINNIGWRQSAQEGGADIKPLSAATRHNFAWAFNKTRQELTRLVDSGAAERPGINHMSWLQLSEFAHGFAMAKLRWEFERRLPTGSPEADISPKLITHEVRTEFSWCRWAKERTSCFGILCLCCLPEPIMGQSRALDSVRSQGARGEVVLLDGYRFAAGSFVLPFWF
jgi:hypothetical protein